MADQTERLRVDVQGLDQLAAATRLVEQHRAALAQATQAYNALVAASRQLQSGNATPDVLRAATGVPAGAPIPPSSFQPDATERAQKQGTAAIAQAQKDLGKAEAERNALLKQQSDLEQQMSRDQQRAVADASRRESVQAQANVTLQKSISLNQQLGQVLSAPLPAGGSTLSSFLGLGLQGANRVHGIGVSALSSVARDVGYASGVPGAGMAAGSVVQGLGSLVTSLPPAITVAIAAGMAAGAVALVGASSGATRWGFAQRLAGASPLPPGAGEAGRENLTNSILGVGQQFWAQPNEAVQTSQSMGRAGVKSGELPGATQLAYAVAVNSGMQVAQTSDMIAQYMVKQNATVQQAAVTFKEYGKAADAAGVSLQTIYGLLNQAQASGVSQNLVPGALASVQSQLGMGFNPVSLMGPALSATGFQAMQLQSVLGVSETTFQQAQRNPAQMLDLQAAALKRMSGGKGEIAAGLMDQGIVGIDTSGLTVDQINSLANIAIHGTPGQFSAAYSQMKVKEAASTSNVTDISKAALLARRETPAQDQINIAGQYAGLGNFTIEKGGTPPPYNPTPSKEHPIPDPGQQNNGTVAPPGMLGSSALPSVPGPTLAQVTATLPAALRPYAASYMLASQATGVPIAVLAAQDLVESGGNPRAVSAAGAQGIGQIMPFMDASLGITDPFNPRQNIMGQAQMDQGLYKQYGKWDSVYAAYNEGPGNFQKQGWSGTDPGYGDKIAAALLELQKSGMNIQVNVTVQDSSGRPLQHTSTTTKTGSTTSPHIAPGQSRGGHR